MRHLFWLAWLAGCVGQGPEGRPDTLYAGEPDLPYEEIGPLTARVCLYGDPDPVGGWPRTSRRTQDRAARKLWDKAQAEGADGVIAVTTEGGCSKRLPFDPLCNCSATARGMAVRWTGPEVAPAPSTP